MIRTAHYVRPKPEPHVIMITARHRFWAHFVTSALSCAAFFGAIVTILWGA
ncbi:MAG: hypothetical protein QM645_14180 [Asticcacaulis sp.]